MIYFASTFAAACVLVATSTTHLIAAEPPSLVVDPVGKVPADPDVGKSMTEIVETRGYAIETHYVTTADGYILTMFRIPSAASETVAPVVLLQHGLLDSSFTWVSNYADESLGYILSDAGYDVWFGNNRGNKFGRNHTTLDPDASPADGFWDFSWGKFTAIFI